MRGSEVWIFQMVAYQRSLQRCLSKNHVRLVRVLVPTHHGRAVSVPASGTSLTSPTGPRPLPGAGASEKDVIPMQHCVMPTPWCCTRLRKREAGTTWQEAGAAGGRERSGSQGGRARGRGELTGGGGGGREACIAGGDLLLD